MRQRKVLAHFPVTDAYTKPLYTSSQMKRNLILILLNLTLISCFISDYESEIITSPSDNYSIKARVNRTDKSATDYAYVLIDLFDKDGAKLTEINSRAGDASKWSIGWTEIGDTIILQSSDIGNKAWTLTNDRPTEIKMTDKLNDRAQYLYSEKYK